MRYKALGRTGLKVSSVILGCGNFGGAGDGQKTAGYGVSQAVSNDIMDAAVEMGVNCFDTSNIYGGGLSEQFIGEWLKARGGNVRDQLLISSKVRHPVGPGPNDKGLSRRHIMQQVEASLRRLRTDYLDLYLSHAPDPDTPIDETLRAFDDLVRQGKIRYFGCSGAAPWMVAKSLWTSDRLGLNHVNWIQDSYSLIDRGLEREMVPFCIDQGLGITPFSPLAGGLLSGKYRRGAPIPGNSRLAVMPKIYAAMMDEQTFEGIEALRGFAADFGSDMPTLALAWLLSKPYITAPIVGPSTVAHLLPARQALQLELTEEEVMHLERFFSGTRGITRVNLASPATQGA